MLSKNNTAYSKNDQKNKYICIHEIMRLIIIKITMKTKNRSHRCGIDRPRSRHGHRYSKYKKCLSMMMLEGIKQKLKNIWSSNHEKVEKKCCIKKGSYKILSDDCFYFTSNVNNSALIVHAYNKNLWPIVITKKKLLVSTSSG